MPWDDDSNATRILRSAGPGPMTGNVGGTIAKHASV